MEKLLFVAGVLLAALGTLWLRFAVLDYTYEDVFNASGDVERARIDGFVLSSYPSDAGYVYEVEACRTISAFSKASIPAYSNIVANGSFTDQFFFMEKHRVLNVD